MKPTIEFLLEKYLESLESGSSTTSDDAMRAECRRHIEMAKQHLAVWRVLGRTEELRERLADELADYDFANRAGHLSGKEAESLGRAFRDLCDACGVVVRQ